MLLAGLACTDDRAITPPAVATLTISPDTATVIVGDSLFLQAVALDQSGHAFIGAPATWSSSNPGVAMTTSTGILTGVSPGKDTVTASSEGHSAQATVTVVAPPPIAFSRDSVGFGAAANGSNPSPDTVAVTNGGGGTLRGLHVSAPSYGAGASGWLAATLSGTTAPTTLVLTAQTGRLTAGTYVATVAVTAPHASNNPHVLTVTFTVT